TRRVRTVLWGPDGERVGVEDSPVTLIPGEEALVRRRFWLYDPALWSPEDPQLHTAEVALDDGEEPITETFGVRTISVDPERGLRINGQPVLLRGACVHHDNGPLGGAAIGRAEERRIELLKDAGFNAVRASHNPLSPAMIEA
uniref:glycoside hydrolase family 2 TIM barrel-domain containing protein n=1 Tax=Picosynechococcus sp. (strain ATCC 27264 / PCC 7002 / PR-6) TaxID=32049 RepID=UPI001C3CB596